MSCYYFNFEILKTRYDPGDQLAWLEKQLSELEEEGGMAILIGHIPPLYYECMHGWSIRFKALYERYQHIIRMSLYGHDHQEWLQLYTPVKNPRRHMGVSILSGSATTHLKMNPSFSMITVDQLLMLPMNMHTHFFNITKANEDPKGAKWELLHDILTEYGMRNMSPEEIF